ncbi:Mitochondrial transcription termination factor family protein [Euphorbia peplus]|nr:Mitochondrial transcription termination factor family protein [Euphorbia peplus]
MPATALNSSGFCCLSSIIPLSNSKQQQSPHLSTKPTKSVLEHHPLYTPLHTNISSQIKEKILCLELMGVDSGKALSLNPCLHSTSLNSIHSIISFLLSKGIRQQDLARIFGMCPLILTSNVKTHLNPVFDFLSNDLKVPDFNFRRVIIKCPRLLVSSVAHQLRPCLFYLKRLGFTDLDALAYQDSILLVSSVENTLIPKLNYLESIGFAEDEAVAMVLRCPALFTFSVENNFKPKFEFFTLEMKGKLDELRDFPHYFGFSLENRIKPRYLEVVESGVEMSLPIMLKSTDEEFNQLLRQGAAR